MIAKIATREIDDAGPDDGDPTAKALGKIGDAARSKGVWRNSGLEIAKVGRETVEQAKWSLI